MLREIHNCSGALSTSLHRKHATCPLGSNSLAHFLVQGIICPGGRKVEMWRVTLSSGRVGYLERFQRST